MTAEQMELDRIEERLLELREVAIYGLTVDEEEERERLKRLLKRLQ